MNWLIGYAVIVAIAWAIAFGFFTVKGADSNPVVLLLVAALFGVFWPFALSAALFDYFEVGGK